MATLKRFSFVFGLIVFLSTASAAHALLWKGVFVAGDNSIENFDNGREDLTQLLGSLGQLESYQLSASKKYISEEKGIYPATFENVSAVFNQLRAGAGEGCLVHMTSHGVKDQGFYLALSGILPPGALASMVNQACGDQPTVVMVSACFSGQFIIEDLKGPNRVILTAARNDRPSFGCSPDVEYTYWDQCLLETIPQSRTWTDLYNNSKSCIARREAAQGVNPSEPQAFIGDNMKSSPIMQ